MTTTPLICAKCGAPVVAGESDKIVVCEYCRTSLRVEGNQTRASDEKKIEEPRKGVEDRESTKAQVEKAGKVLTESLRSGANIAASAAQVVDRVGTMLFWTKVALVIGLIVLLLGCCVVPTLFFSRVFG